MPLERHRHAGKAKKLSKCIILHNNLTEQHKVSLKRPLNLHKAIILPYFLAVWRLMIMSVIEGKIFLARLSVLFYF